MEKIDFSAEFDDDTIYLTIDGEEIEAKISNVGNFRFSYRHPEIGDKTTYTGTFLSKETIIIYPILGLGVLTPGPIKIKRKST